MATYTSNYGWTKPSGSDNVDISVLNDNLDDQDSTIHDAFLNMAPPFSELSTYAVDDIVLYTTGLYKCHTAVVTPGSWTGSTNWQGYKLSEGGGGGLTLGETSSTAYRGDRGKVAYDHSQTTGNPHGTTKSDVGLGNVPNVSTNDQEPTFTEASTRNNIASGEKLSVILGKVQKFFNDLKTVAFSGSYTDLTSQPQINSNTLSGNKTTSDLGINADNVMMSDGVTSVEVAVDALTAITIGTPIDISSYSSPNKLYTCPSDGYIRVIADVAVGNQTILKFGDSYTLAKSEVAVANHNVTTTVYVRKGMQFYCTRDETTYSKIQFLPIS